MKQFIITTTSHSGDNYIYTIQHWRKPTRKQINEWLLKNGNDIYDGQCYENVNDIKEIKTWETL